MNKKICSQKKLGFTLIELLIVIAIIGILAGVVTVSMSGAKDNAKRASAITTASSVLPELVTCADDGGYAKSTVPVAGELICCKTNSACADTAANRVSGHTALWTDISTKTGWSYKVGSGTLASGDYSFKLQKTGETDVLCSMQTNSCE